MYFRKEVLPLLGRLRSAEDAGPRCPEAGAPGGRERRPGRERGRAELREAAEAPRPHAPTLECARTAGPGLVALSFVLFFWSIFGCWLPGTAFSATKLISLFGALLFCGFIICAPQPAPRRPRRLAPRSARACGVRQTTPT